jgi:hypothetical protein
LIEISVPRGIGALLGRYWQTLVLMISILMIVAGLVTAQPTVSGFGWTVLGFVVRAGPCRGLLIGLAALIVAGLAIIGGFQSYGYLSGRWQVAQATFCDFFDNCPRPTYSSAGPERK